MTERGVIRLSRLIDHPPAKVWKALTDPAILAKWWAAGDVKPVVGHRFTLDMGSWGQQPCEVLAVEPERLLSYSFAPARWTRRSRGASSRKTAARVCTRARRFRPRFSAGKTGLRRHGRRLASHPGTHGAGHRRSRRCLRRKRSTVHDDLFAG